MCMRCSWSPVSSTKDKTVCCNEIWNLMWKLCNLWIICCWINNQMGLFELNHTAVERLKVGTGGEKAPKVKALKFSHSTGKMRPTKCGIQPFQGGWNGAIQWQLTVGHPGMVWVFRFWRNFSKLCCLIHHFILGWFFWMNMALVDDAQEVKVFFGPNRESKALFWHDPYQLCDWISDCPFECQCKYLPQFPLIFKDITGNPLAFVAHGMNRWDWYSISETLFALKQQKIWVFWAMIGFWCRDFREVCWGLGMITKWELWFQKMMLQRMTARSWRMFWC